MNLIAIETASGPPSVCLCPGAGGNLLWRGEPRSGPEPILAAVGNLLETAGLAFGDLDVIACGRGPGAFTGVRLAISLAQGLALGIGRSVLPVSGLAALAWRAHYEHGWTRILACLDARRGEVYWAAFDCGDESPRILGEEAVAEPEGVVLPPGKWACAGSGVPLITVAGGMATDSGLTPDARAIAAVALPAAGRGESVAAGGVEPAYLRCRVATPKR